MEIYKRQKRVSPENFRKSAATRTFQEIYDFCRLNRNYRTYFDIPDSFTIKDRNVYRYYNNALHSGLGQSRGGTYIYSQSMNELARFMGDTGHNFYIHAERWTYRILNRKIHHYDDYVILYITTSITGKGVRIEFDDPFGKTRERYAFIARSHRPYNEDGVVGEVESYVNHKLLFPKGRWRDLQLHYNIGKKEFPDWYKHTYKPMLKRQADAEYLDMLDRVDSQKPYLDYSEAASLLELSGIFFDLNINDEFGKDELICEFMGMCNR